MKKIFLNGVRGQDQIRCIETGFFSRKMSVNKQEFPFIKKKLGFRGKSSSCIYFEYLAVILNI